jgi:hypothetical protein
MGWAIFLATFSQTRLVALVIAPTPKIVNLVFVEFQPEFSKPFYIINLFGRDFSPCRCVGAEAL